MQSYTDVLFSANGPVPNVSITVKTSPGGAVATIYSDNGVTTIANPIVTGANGRFLFYAADGYYTLTISGTGITTQSVGPILLQDYATTSPIASKLAVVTGAALVGTTGPSTVQADITARPTSATLASSTGSSLVGFSHANTYGQGTTGLALQGYINVKNAPYNAVGDGVTDDTAACQAALTAAAGKALFFPTGIYLVSTELSYNVATSGSIMIFGNGPTSILKASGASNKVLHISGTAGVTNSPVSLRSFAIQSATSGTSSAGLHLDGIAHWFVEDVWVDGKNKMTTGMQMTAAQEGQVSGGQIQNCITGGRLEDNAGGAIRSNGIDWHGMTLANTTTNFIVASQSGSGGADDVFFHANHLTGAAMQIDVSTGVGMGVFANNHLEPLAGNSGMIVRAGRAYISGNSFFGFVGTTDINLSASAASESKIIGNLINANVSIAAGVNDTLFAFNSTGGTITDSGTRTRNFGNRAYSGTPLVGSQIYDHLTINSQQAAGASMLTVQAPAVAADWGIQINGAGAAQDIYYRFGVGAVIAGRTDNSGLINFKSAPSGTIWGSVSATGVRGVMVIGTGAVAVTAAGEVGISGQTTTTIGGAGAAAALPANPVGYVTINVAGSTMKIPYYNP